MKNNPWFIGCLIALVAGICTRLVLPHEHYPPIVANRDSIGIIERLNHYSFHPVAYILVVILLIYRIFQLKFYSVWSILFSFIVGGILTTTLLSFPLK